MVFSQEHRDFLVTSVPALYTELASFFAAQLAFREFIESATALQQTAQSLAGQGVLLELQLGGAQTATQKAESGLTGSLQQMEALRAGVEAAAKESRQWWDQHETAIQGLKGSGPAKEQVRRRMFVSPSILLGEKTPEGMLRDPRDEVLT